MALLIDDPLDIALDVNGDIDLSGGGPRLISGVAGVAQLVRQAMLTYAGEWFADRTVGVPYYDIPGYVTESQALLGQKFDRDKTIRAFSRELVKVPGVAKVISMEVDFDNKLRVLSVSWEVTTTFGDTISDDTKVGVNG